MYNKRKNESGLSYEKDKQICIHSVSADINAVSDGLWQLRQRQLCGRGEEIAPGAVVDDIFPAFYNSDAFINGYDAIKFTGVQEADDYGTARTYDVYGYCAVINDLPVIIVGVTEQGKDQDTEELRAEQIHYVDEMIQTARVTPW